MKTFFPVTSTSLLFAIILLVGCGRKDAAARSNEGVDTDAYVASAVIGTVGSSALEAEITPVTKAETPAPAAGGKPMVPGGTPAAPGGSAVVSAPSLPKPETTIPNQCRMAATRMQCVNDTLKSRFQNCAAHDAVASMEGEWTAKYLPLQACDTHQKTRELIEGAEISKTTHLFVVHGADANLNLTTDFPSDLYPADSSLAGGVVISRGSANSESITRINVQGLRKTVVGKENKLRSDLLLHAQGASIRVRGSKPTKNRVASGIMLVENLGRRQSMTVSLENVMWGDPRCCYPTSGSARIDSQFPDGTLSTSHLNFDQPECGKASALQRGRTQVVSLNFCEE